MTAATGAFPAASLVSGGSAAAPALTNLPLIQVLQLPLRGCCAHPLGHPRGLQHPGRVHRRCRYVFRRLVDFSAQVRPGNKLNKLTLLTLLPLSPPICSYKLLLPAVHCCAAHGRGQGPRPRACRQQAGRAHLSRAVLPIRPAAATAAPCTLPRFCVAAFCFVLCLCVWFPLNHLTRSSHHGRLKREREGERIRT